MKICVYTCKQVHVAVEARSAWFLLRQGLSHFAGSLLRLGSLKRKPQGSQTPPLQNGTEVSTTPVCSQFVGLFLRQGLCM